MPSTDPPHGGPSADDAAPEAMGLKRSRVLAPVFFNGPFGAPAFALMTNATLDLFQAMDEACDPLTRDAAADKALAAIAAGADPEPRNPQLLHFSALAALSDAVARTPADRQTTAQKDWAPVADALLASASPEALDQALLELFRPARTPWLERRLLKAGARLRDDRCLKHVDHEDYSSARMRAMIERARAWGWVPAGDTLNARNVLFKTTRSGKHQALEAMTLAFEDAGLALPQCVMANDRMDLVKLALGSWISKTLRASLAQPTVKVLLEAGLAFGVEDRLKPALAKMLKEQPALADAFEAWPRDGQQRRLEKRTASVGQAARPRMRL